MAQCGDKPRRIAFGVAPLGNISIGIVPMGVWWAGLEGMGPRRLGAPAAALQQHHRSASGPAPANLLAYPTREEALEQARRLGCSGVHAMGSRWMPCAEHPH